MTLEAKNNRSMKHKPLSELSLEELWQLFPIELKPHDHNYSTQYNNEKSMLEKLISKQHIARISHIGSTAVRNIIAKPIVDILLELTDSADIPILKKQLAENGWILMAQEALPLKLSFNKGYTLAGFADQVFHLHIRYLGHCDELYFRDYLQQHHDIAENYAKLKLMLLQKHKYNRDAYTVEKTDFIKKNTPALPKKNMAINMIYTKAKN